MEIYFIINLIKKKIKHNKNEFDSKREIKTKNRKDFNFQGKININKILKKRV